MSTHFRFGIKQLVLIVVILLLWFAYRQLFPSPMQSIYYSTLAPILIVIMLIGYFIMYRITVTDQQLIMHSLFNKKTYNIKDITTHRFLREAPITGTILELDIKEETIRINNFEKVSKKEELLKRIKVPYEEQKLQRKNVRARYFMLPIILLALGLLLLHTTNLPIWGVIIIGLAAMTIYIIHMRNMFRKTS